RARHSGPRENFCYDITGRITARNDERVEYGARIVRHGGVRREYDEQGRLVARIARDGRRDSYRWDSRGNLAAATLHDGRVVDYTYDVFGRRVRKVIASRSGADRSITRFLWNGERLAHEIVERARRQGDPVTQTRTYFYLE